MDGSLVTPAEASLAALGVAIVISLSSRINVGLVAIVCAWVVGVASAGWKAEAVMATFPASLFLTLAGVTLLLAAAEANGTMAALSSRAIGWCGGRVARLPLMFFVLAALLSAVGPGAVASTAMVAPVAMSVGAGAGIPPFLSALMVANGANAGNLSPISSVGLVVDSIFDKMGYADAIWRATALNFVGHALVTLAAFALFGGRQLLRRSGVVAVRPVAHPIEQKHWITMAVTTAWMGGVVFAGLPPGLSAFAAVCILAVVRATSDNEAIKRLPLPAILMVTGMTMLVGVVEKTGGLDLFSRLLADMTNPRWVNAASAFVTGAISTYSSTSGVVYPAFLPTVTGIVERLGGGHPLEIALSIVLGAALVDVSPFSTIGALCVAAQPAGGDTNKLFRQLVAWGLSMTVVGALLAHVLAPMFAR